MNNMNNSFNTVKRQQQERQFEGNLSLYFKKKIQKQTE